MYGLGEDLCDWQGGPQDYDKYRVDSTQDVKETRPENDKKRQSIKQITIQ